MNTLIGKVIVNNAPTYAENQYIVCRLDRGELWFWGAWDKKEEAEKVADKFENGLVVRG